MARARRRRRSSSGDGWTIALGLLAFLAALGLGGGMLWLNATVERPPVLDAATLCPLGGARSITVVLVDASDALPAVAQTQLSTALSDLAEALPRFGLLELRLLDPADPRGRILFSRCNPGNGEGLSEWTANPEAARRRWLEAFHQPIEALIADGLPGMAGDSSPIMAAIQRIAVERFEGAARDGVPKRLVVVSDMLENTADYSHYGGGDLSYDRYRASRAAPRYGTDLRAAEVTLFYVQRASGAADPVAHLAFWADWIAENRGRLVEAVKLQGEG